MSDTTLKALKAAIIERYDPDDVVEALDISTEELVDAFEDKLLAAMNKFDDDLNIDQRVVAYYAYGEEELEELFNNE